MTHTFAHRDGRMPVSARFPRLSRFICAAGAILMLEGAAHALPPPVGPSFVKPAEVRKTHRNPKDLSEKDDLRSDRLLSVESVLINAKKDRIKNTAKLSESIYLLRNAEAGRDDFIRAMAYLSDYEWRDRKLDAIFRERVANNILPFLKDADDTANYVAYSALTKFDWNGVSPDIIKKVVERSLAVMKNDRVMALLGKQHNVLGNIGGPAIPAVFDELRGCKAGSSIHDSMLMVLAYFEWDKLPAVRHAEAAKIMLLKIRERRPAVKGRAGAEAVIILDCMVFRYLNWQQIPPNVASEANDVLMQNLSHGMSLPYKTDVIRISIASVFIKMGDSGVASMLRMLNSDNPSVFYPMLDMLSRFDDSRGIRLSEKNRSVLVYALTRFGKYNAPGIDVADIRKKATEAIQKLRAKKAVQKVENNK
jgi:hypothetical protein